MSCELLCDDVKSYSLVPNRRGVGISGGGLEKSPKHNKRVGWNSRGVGGLEMMQQFSYVFFFVSIEAKITKPECAILCSQ